MPNNKPPYTNKLSNRLDALKSGEKYVKDAKGNQSLVQSDGTYVQLANGRNRYLPKGSTAWKDITDPKALEAINKMDSRFGVQSKNIPTKTENGIDFQSEVQKANNTKIPREEASATEVSPKIDNTINIDNPQFSTKADKPSRFSQFMSNPNNKYNLSVLKDVGLDVAGAAAQYANSKKALSALSKVRIPDAPQQSYVNASRVNMDVDRGMNENALGTGINALKRGFSDANTAAAVRGSLLSNYTQQGSKINQEERNQNIQAQNQANIYNSEIQGKNATAQYLKNTAEMSKQIDLIKGKQLANQELIGGLTGAVTNERRRAAEDNTTLLGLSTKDPEFMKYYGSVAKGRSGYAASSNSLTDEQAKRVSDAAKTMQIPTNKDGKSKYGGVLNKMRNGGKLNKMC